MPQLESSVALDSQLTCFVAVEATGGGGILSYQSLLLTPLGPRKKVVGFLCLFLVPSTQYMLHSIRWLVKPSHFVVAFLAHRIKSLLHFSL